MILKEIISTLRDLANSHADIEGFYTGLSSEHNDSMIQYPAMRVVFPYNAVASQDDDVLSITFDLTLLCNTVDETTPLSAFEVNTNYTTQDDTLNEIDEPLVDETELREKAIRILSQYIEGIRMLEPENDYFILSDGWRIDSLERFANDFVTGCKTTLTISVSNDYKCQSRANYNNTVWKDVDTNGINFDPYKCPDCPPIIPFPTNCNDLLSELSTTQLNQCILPTYDFSDSNVLSELQGQQLEDLADYIIPFLDFTDIDIQNMLSVQQTNDLEDWLCTPCAQGTQYSMLFDGVNESVNLYDRPQYDFTQFSAFSATSWVKSSNYAGNYQGIITKRSAGSVGWSFHFYLGDLYLLLQSSATEYILVRTSGISFADSTWNHVAFTVDGSGSGSGVRLYVNDVQVATATIQDNLNGTMANSIGVIIGSEVATPMPFNGNISYTRLFNIELTSTDITDDYNGGTMLETSLQSANQVLGWKGGQGALFSTLWLFPNEIDFTQQSPTSITMEIGDRTTDVPV